MAKKSIIAGEYIIQIDDHDHVDIVRSFSNAKATMTDIARSNNFTVEEKWTTQDLGRHLVKTFGDGKTAQFDDITINKQPNGKIEIYQECKNVKQALRNISEQLGYEYDNNWNTQTFGRKLVDYLIEHKEEADKILKTPYSKRKKEETIEQELIDNQADKKELVEEEENNESLYKAVSLYGEMGECYFEDVTSAIKAGLQDYQLEIDDESWDEESGASLRIRLYTEDNLWDILESISAEYTGGGQICYEWFEPVRYIFVGGNGEES